MTSIEHDYSKPLPAQQSRWAYRSVRYGCGKKGYRGEMGQMLLTAELCNCGTGLPHAFALRFFAVYR